MQNEPECEVPPLNPHYRQRAALPLRNGDLEISLPGWLCVRDVDSIESFFALLIERFREDATPNHASGAKASDGPATVAPLQPLGDTPAVSDVPHTPPRA